MSIKHASIAILSLFAGTVAMAHPEHQEGRGEVENLSQYAPVPLSRAEVIADLEIYRKSGLADLISRESPDVFSADYQAAQARYRALRTSPEFATLVSKIARERGESVGVASAGASILAK